MDFWEYTLGSPSKIVAPMVDASELPWRLLSRRYGAQLCYTPMLNSAIFNKDPKYRRDSLQTCTEDKPLIVQFCGNDPDTLLSASLVAQEYCSAIDLNLGCPQAIAKRGHYGAFLQDEWVLLYDIVRKLSTNLSVPVTCKIRRFETVQKTVDYCKMLESAGCSMITVHARTKEQKGPLTGLADWSYVKAVRDSVKIPVISNGNILCLNDYERCLEETAAMGVMVAEGNLYNPAIFTGTNPVVWQIALEYLDLCKQYSCPMSYIRGHLFKLFQQILNIPSNAELRKQLGECKSIDGFVGITEKIRDIYEPFHLGLQIWNNEMCGVSNDLRLPPWLCQAYTRELASTNSASSTRETAPFTDIDGNIISRKQMKKLRRKSRRPSKINALPKNIVAI